RRRTLHIHYTAPSRSGPSGTDRTTKAAGGGNGGGVPANLVAQTVGGTTSGGGGTGGGGGATGGPLYVTCPANMSVTSPDGGPVVVTYTATTDGGFAPISISGTPASGTAFPVGTTKVSVKAQSSDGQTSYCTFSVT